VQGWKKRLHENQSLSSYANLAAYLVEDVRSGGMGNVYIAEHKKWKLKLAIKAPNEKILSDKGLFNRVLKEAEQAEVICGT
jgi:hypothetical protein